MRANGPFFRVRFGFRVHLIAWSEFDIAAFKEALKVSNQFGQNVAKRERSSTALPSNC